MNKEQLRKIFISILAIYTAIVVAFYFLAEDQLRYRESRNNIIVTDSDSVTDELVKGMTISQDFKNEIDNIENISIEFNNYYRSGSGDVVVELFDNTRLLMSKTISVDTINETRIVSIDFSKPIQEEKGKVLTLKIHLVNGDNSGLTVLMKQNINDGSIIKINNTGIRGSLCYSVKGTDDIHAYEYYWYITIIAGLLLAALLYKSYRDFCNDHYNYLTSSIMAIARYKFLIKQLVSRDFKSKYKRSVLGLFWSFLNPLLTMLVQFFVFSNFFSGDTNNYPVYLLIGVICFNFFKETTEMSLVSITGNANLLKKVYVPKYIFPFTKTISSTINLGLSLIPLLFVALFAGVGFHKTIFLIFFFLICLIVFSLGMGMFLSCLNVFFRDTEFLWRVITQIWMYATPIFYPAEIVPEKYRFILRINPLYHIIGNVRKCMIDGVSPEMTSYLYCVIFAVVSMLIGSYVFKKNQDKFTLHL